MRIVIHIALAMPAVGLKQVRVPAPGGTNTSSAEVVFVAGVEGAGHHLMKAIFKKMKIVDRRMQMVDLPPQWRCDRRASFDPKYTANLQESFRTLQSGNVYLFDDPSYPSCGTGSHAGRSDLSHPRIDLIAKAASKAGVQLHIIFLHRNLDDCLAADCLRRSAESCGARTEALMASAGALSSQLRQLEPGTVSCLKFGASEKMERALREAYPGKVSDQLVHELYKDHVSADARSAQKGWRVYVDSLRRANSTLDHQCWEVRRMLATQKTRRATAWDGLSRDLAKIWS